MVAAGTAAAAILLPLLLASTALAQDFGWRRGGWRAAPLRERLPTRDGAVDRGFTFCRLLYRSVRSEALGHGWNTDHPVSDLNFVTRFSQLTAVSISRWEEASRGSPW
jgi:hypothetical protein